MRGISLALVLGVSVVALPAWADAPTEEQFAASVVVPRCQAQWQVDETKAEIAREKANPSGVVDLVLLHQLGQQQQALEASIKKLDTAYQARRHHAFKGWLTEPACIVEYDSEMAAQGCTRVEEPSGKGHHWACP